MDLSYNILDLLAYGDQLLCRKNQCEIYLGNIYYTFSL